jgi:hypothetical protein
LLAGVLAGRPARGEPMGPLVQGGPDGASGRAAVYGDTGLDGALVATVGAAGGAAFAGERLAVVGWADVTWVAGNLDFDDARYRVGARADVLKLGPWRLRASLAPTLRTISTDAYSARALGTDVHLQPGFDRGRFSAEIDLALDEQWLTYIAPTDTYRQVIYAGARGGWYRTTGFTPRVGAGGALRFASFEIDARGGWERTGALDFLPALYAVLSVSYWVGGDAAGAR